MKNLLLTTALLLLCGFQIVYAQTTEMEKKLARGIESYNQASNKFDIWYAQKNDANYSALLDEIENSHDILRTVLKSGDSDLRPVAEYFNTNLYYLEGQILVLQARNNEGWTVLEDIEEEMNAYTASSFPLRYKKDDKNFVIQWTDFSFSQLEYQTAMAELANLLGYTTKSLTYCRKVINATSEDGFFLSFCNKTLIDIKSKRKEYDDEFCKQILAYCKSYPNLKEETRNNINSYNPLTPVDMYTRLDEAIAAVPSIGKNGYYYAEIAQILGKSSNSEDINAASKAFEKALLAGYGGFDFANNAVDFFISKNNPRTGLLATNRLAQLTAEDNCSGLDKLALAYSTFKESKKAAEYQSKAEKCRKKIEKANRHSNSQFNVYLGAYLLPLLKTNANRDYGMVLNLSGRRAAWEFSYMKINRNKENVFDLTIRDVDASQDDLSRWDGFYAHIAPKFYRKEGNIYSGFLLGYAQKNFDPMTAYATRDADGLASVESFEPKVTQYILALNMGSMLLVKGVGADFYMSIGPTYNRFDTGNPLDRSAYTIQNPILENRKDPYWGLIMRIGMTIGLNLGRGNMH